LNPKKGKRLQGEEARQHAASAERRENSAPRRRKSVRLEGKKGTPRAKKENGQGKENINNTPPEEPLEFKKRNDP